MSGYGFPLSTIVCIPDSLPQRLITSVKKISVKKKDRQCSSVEVKLDEENKMLGIIEG